MFLKVCGKYMILRNKTLIKYPRLIISVGSAKITTFYLENRKQEQYFDQSNQKTN